jgi:CRISPR-associated protein Cmr2
MNNFQKRMTVAIAWCLAWGDGENPQHSKEALHELRQAILTNRPLDDSSLQEILQQTQSLVGFSNDSFEFPKTIEKIETLIKQHNIPWDSKIGLVYGGVTKVKSYVFESADLQEIRGASGLLDRINLVDLPAFFEGENSDLFPQCQNAPAFCKRVRDEWLYPAFPELENALVPELVIYSTGGNILAFCPAALVTPLANAIEKRYANETLTANSCAVGRKFKLLETRLGLLADSLDQTQWIEWYQEHRSHPLMPQLLGLPASQTLDEEELTNRLEQQKNFNELVKQLTLDFERRRNGNAPEGFSAEKRPSRRYPPMFETHPYLRRDQGDHRSAIFRAETSATNPNAGLPGDPWFSEASARKRLMGQITKRELKGKLPQWWKDAQKFAERKKAKLEWPSVVQGDSYDNTSTESWIKRFEDYLKQSGLQQNYFSKAQDEEVQEARSIQEIANSRIFEGPPATGYVAFIYADGNNMGGYIRSQIRSPQKYQEFSQDVFKATTESVYKALYEHLKPRRYKPDPNSSRRNKDPLWLYPFEIVAIGGDDVLLIVPADKALAVAKSLGEEFESALVSKYPEARTYDPEQVHRYLSNKLPSGKNQCRLSLSAGVLITAQNTPFYYAEDLTGQLMKSAKKRAKALRKDGYYGGTVDFLVMKSVTMISSDLKQFRKQGLTQSHPGKPTLKQYAAPYTLYELDGLLQTAQALKTTKFPRSQLYQVRSLLERGKQTAILNYRYFRLRLTNQEAQSQLESIFEKGWCQPKDPKNPGNLAPWMSYEEKDPTAPGGKRMAYETLWRELVDIYDFVSEEPSQDDSSPSTTMESGRATS